MKEILLTEKEMVFLVLLYFHDSSNDIPNYKKLPIKVSQNKNQHHVNMQPFYITVLLTPSEYFCAECIL